MIILFYVNGGAQVINQAFIFNPIAPTVSSGGTRTNNIINPIMPTLLLATRTNNIINPITPTASSGGIRTNNIINPMTPTVSSGGTRTNSIVSNVHQEGLRA